jgi:flagellar basal-body rod modification protein FlgD
MTGISGTSGTGATSGMWTGNTSETGTVGKAELGKDAFLNLLVAQLKYQDPSNPTDSSQFMQQTATFTMVEKLEEMAKAQTSMVNAQNLASATSLVGREISWTEGTATKTGVVTAVQMNNGTAQLAVGDLTVDLSKVTKVTPAPAAGSPGPASGGSAAT